MPSSLRPVLYIIRYAPKAGNERAYENNFLSFANRFGHSGRNTGMVSKLLTSALNLPMSLDSWRRSGMERRYGRILYPPRLTERVLQGVGSQVRLIRVIGMVTESKEEMGSLRQIGKFVVPKTQSKSHLCYEFATPPKANVISFQFLANYGGKELCPPKIYLFNTGTPT